MLYSIGISNIVLAILNIIKIKKITHFSYNISNKLLIQTLIILPIILICKLSYNWLFIITGKLLAIIICSIISVICYFMLIFTFDVVNINIVKSILTRNAKKTRPTVNS